MKQRKEKIILLLSALFILALTSCTSINKESEFKALLNDDDWDGWYLKIKSNDAELAKKVYALEDGIVHVFNENFPDTITLRTGENATHGLFYTKKKYSKFILRFEYKWGSKIANNFHQYQYDAGCYYHVFDDQIWPKGIEYQVRYNHILNKNHTGDFWAAGATFQWYAGEDNLSFLAPKDGGTPQPRRTDEHLAKSTTNFNALNKQWNKCEIIVMGNEYAIHKLNGEIVNMATDLSVSEGIIGFQSETAEISYRNIQIKEFNTSIPMEEFMQ